jgi:hypothetical protein
VGQAGRPHNVAGHVRLDARRLLGPGDPQSAAHLPGDRGNTPIEIATGVHEPDRELGRSGDARHDPDVPWQPDQLPSKSIWCADEGQPGSRSDPELLDERRT